MRVAKRSAIEKTFSATSMCSTQRLRHALQQVPRVGMLRPVQDLRYSSLLNDLTRMHHENALRHFLKDRRVVADEQKCEREPLLQVFEQSQNIGLDGCIPRRRRLIGNHKSWFTSQRLGNGYSLALASAQFVMIRGVNARDIGEPHLLQHVLCLFPATLAAP